MSLSTRQACRLPSLIPVRRQSGRARLHAWGRYVTFPVAVPDQRCVTAAISLRFRLICAAQTSACRLVAIRGRFTNVAFYVAHELFFTLGVGISSLTRSPVGEDAIVVSSLSIQ